MRSDDEQRGGGSGGAFGDEFDEKHSDKRSIAGIFERDAIVLTLEGVPLDNGKSAVNLIAHGDEAGIVAQAGKNVCVIGGALGDYHPDALDDPGVTLFAQDKISKRIRLQLGNFESPDARSIMIDNDAIWIDAGVSGEIILTAGPDAHSFIKISPTGITIKGPVVNIN
jgi:hypothetical protein